MRKVWIRMWRVWLSDKWSLNLRSKEKKGLFFQKIKNFGQKSCFEFTTYICSDSVFAGLGLRSSASFLSFYFLILLPRWTIFYILLTICTLKDTITQTCSKAFHNISLNNNCFPLFVVPSEANFTFSPNFFSPHWDANFKLSLFFQHIREWISVCVCVRVCVSVLVWIQTHTLSGHYAPRLHEERVRTRLPSRTPPKYPYFLFDSIPPAIGLTIWCGWVRGGEGETQTWVREGEIKRL